jgi:hypothetical protein
MKTQIKHRDGSLIAEAENVTVHKLASAERYALREADLRGADLRGADLGEADLIGANLSGANLREADLREANLSGADLSGADLRDANLSGADLSGAGLRGADLSGANIDFSCWPLWCGSFDVVIDADQFAQLAYHLCRVNVKGRGQKRARGGQKALADIAGTWSGIERHNLEGDDD